MLKNGYAGQLRGLVLYLPQKIGIVGCAFVFLPQLLEQMAFSGWISGEEGVVPVLIALLVCREGSGILAAVVSGRGPVIALVVAVNGG